MQQQAAIMAAGHQPVHTDQHLHPHSHHVAPYGPEPVPMDQEGLHHEQMSESQYPTDLCENGVEPEGPKLDVTEGEMTETMNDRTKEKEEFEPIKISEEIQSDEKVQAKVPPWLAKRKKRKAAAETAAAEQSQSKSESEEQDKKQESERKDTKPISVASSEEEGVATEQQMAESDKKSVEVSDDTNQKKSDSGKQSNKISASSESVLQAKDNDTGNLNVEVNQSVTAEEESTKPERSKEVEKVEEDEYSEPSHKVVTSEEKSELKPREKDIKDIDKQPCEVQSEANTESGNSKSAMENVETADSDIKEKETAAENEPSSNTQTNDASSDNAGVKLETAAEQSTEIVEQEESNEISQTLNSKGDVPIVTEVTSDGAQFKDNDVAQPQPEIEQKTEEVLPKITYESDPVRYTYAEQTKDTVNQQQESNEEQQSSQHQDVQNDGQIQQTPASKPALPVQDPLQQDNVLQQDDPMQQQLDELQQQMEQVYNTPQNYEECRMQMILAATLAQLPPDMTIGDLYQYINPNILDSMSLPPAPAGILQEKLEQQRQLEELEPEYHAKYREVIARRAQIKMQEREVPSLIDLHEHLPAERGRYGRKDRRGRGRGRGREYDSDIGGYVPYQRMDTTYTAGEDEFIGPQLPAHLKHLVPTREEPDHAHYQQLDLMAPEHDDMIDDDEDTEEYAGYEEGEVVDGEHWAHPKNWGRPNRECKRRSKELCEGGSPNKRVLRDDPLGFDEGDVISHDISDFHRRLLRMSGNIEEGHVPAFSTGVQYSQSGDHRPPYVRNQRGRYEEDIVPRDYAPPPSEATHQPAAHGTPEVKKENMAEAVMQFIRPKYHEEGYSERFHAAPAGEITLCSFKQVQIYI